MTMIITFITFPGVQPRLRNFKKDKFGSAWYIWKASVQTSRRFESQLRLVQFQELSYDLVLQ